MLIDKAVIVNWALNDVGHYATFSIDDESDLAGQVELCWQRCIDHCVGLADWHDFRKTFKLSRRAEEPQNGWKYEFLLPGGRIGEPLKILDRAGQCPSPLRNFDREENSIFADVEDIWARCKVERDPEHWDPAWRAAFTVALSSYFATAILMNTDLAQKKWDVAFGTPSREGGGGLFGRLMAQNRAGAPVGSPVLDAEPLGLARSSGGGSWYGRG